MDNPLLDDNAESENIEVKLLLEAIYLKYGSDFRGYSRLSVKRQILKMVKDEKLSNISDLQHKMIWDTEFFQKLLPRFSINVTEHFRDPSFYKTFREDIIPVLKTYPSLKIWHAGCATGQEVYSMAIVLQEEGLYEKTQVYATDINLKALDIARQGIYSSKELPTCSRNYIQSGGKKSFSDYIVSQDKNFAMDDNLKENILFSDHNLVMDETFVETNVILCRNVLIYFDEKLIKRVTKLFYDSLRDHGFLCLGSRERIIEGRNKDEFKVQDRNEKIYRKIPDPTSDYVHNIFKFD